MILRTILLYLSLLNYSYGFEDVQITSDCPNSNCDFLISRIKKVVSSSKSEGELLNGIRFSLNDKLVKKFEFSYELNNKNKFFHFSAETNSFFQNTTFEIDSKLNDEKKIMSLLGRVKIPYIGKVYDDDLLRKIKGDVRSILVEAGYLDVRLGHLDSYVDNRAYVKFKVSLNKPYILKMVNVTCVDNPNCNLDKELLELTDFKGSVWKRKDFRDKINQVISKKRKKGFYNYSIKILDNEIIKNDVFINIKISEGVGHNFFISGAEKVSKIDILNFIKSSVYKNRIRIDSNEIKEIVKSYMRNLGYFSSTVKVNDVEGKNRNRNTIVNHFIKLRENDHTRVSGIQINGVGEKLSLEIKDVIENNQTNFHLRGYYLESDFVRYNNIIKEYLASKGYHFSEVLGPYSKFNKNNSSVLINFKVHVGNKVEISDIDYGFSEGLLNKRFKNSLMNKPGGVYFSKNIDIDKNLIILHLKESGFYYAEPRKGKKKEEYFTDNYQKVLLDYDINPGKKVKIGKIKIFGLEKTKKDIVEREIDVKEGSLLRPSVITQINDQIVPLNLFSFVNVKPSKPYLAENNEYYSDLIIQLKERDYGLVRVSPGYRSDLGFKIESLFQRNNIMGKNEAFSFNLRGNRRTSLSYLDSRRQNEANDRIEFAGVTSYTIPYIFGSRIRLQTNAELVRRRFYGFDADIGRVSFRLTKNFSKSFGTTFKYQFENIKQYDATQDSDAGYFRIGSLMSTIFVDLRDRVVNPSGGSYHGLSLEFGNPSLLSMDDNNLEINFVKVVSRNRLYYSAGGLIFAASVSAGFQKNLANDLFYSDDGSTVQNNDGSLRTRGMLPSVKVFRLEGIDTVRGFSEEEINKLDDGEDILDKRIQGAAYLLNTKFEIRRLLSQSVIGAVFFDAGRLYVNAFKPLKLRKSAGVSFKFLTPVGTLDFDYGLKLDRKSFSDGRSELFGRFHLAIGFF